MIVHCVTYKSDWMFDLFGGHADSTVQPNDLAVEVAVLDDVLHQMAILVRVAQARRVGDLGEKNGMSEIGIFRAEITRGPMNNPLEYKCLCVNSQRWVLEQ